MHHYNDPTAIDPHRPWIKDARDNPHAMNWGQTLFNPLGTSPKLHFSRAWTFMFLGRVLLFIVPVFAVFVGTLAGAGLGGAWKPVSWMILPVPALLVPFFFFTLVTEFTSWVAHTRRLHEAHRSTLWAILVLVPLMLAMVGFYVGAQAGVKQYHEMHAPAAVAAEAGDAAAVPAETGTRAKKDKAPQKKRQGPPPSEREMAASSGLGFGLMLWAPASFLVMFWSLLYVARMPNGGVGRFKTGSDVAQGEEELPDAAYAAG